MIKKLTVVLLLMVSCLLSFAGEGDYAVSKIPPALLKDAHVIKRMEKISFEVLNNGEAIMNKKYALTILDENGEKYAGFFEYYDAFHSIKNIEGTLYDAEGKELKKLKNKQIIDFSGVGEDDLADDDRLKHHNFYYKAYPYTVEYEVEIKYTSTLFFPDWFPREAENYSVEQSSISIVAPLYYQVRYRPVNYEGNPAETQENDKKTLAWQIKDLPAIKNEYASPSWEEINTGVLFAPSEFSLAKYKGNMNSWLDYGKFQFTLNEGRDQLPENIKQHVHEIADKITDPMEKISKLYEYMQQNTRYISIQLGIGGWQPFDAKYVATKAYGDCKALSNYMYSLLKEAGIRSHYSLIRAGRNADKVVSDFPCANFNHIILCVPLQKDTVWLECTSQTLPAGYLSDFTCDRYALLIDENGGHLVRTPKYSMKDNYEIRHIKATLDEEATLQVRAITSYGGLQQDLYHNLIHSLSKDKVKEFLHEQLDFATYDISNFEYKESRSKLPSVEETLDITISNYATITGKRLFIIPNIMTRTHPKLEADEERKSDIELRFEYKDVDTVEIDLPAGYTTESMPQDVTITSIFGKYNCSVRLTGHKLSYYRNMEYNSGRFPAKDYAELLKFNEAIYKADRNKVVLVKNQ